MRRSWFLDLGWREVFFAALLFHFCCCMVGWNHSLLEHHSYRQTQTAINTEYMLLENAWINYLTPVLGPPWQVPMEFPLYQMIVAAICLMLQTPLDQTGRAVSLLFFYASLWPMNLYLRFFVPERNLRLMILSLVLVSPLYIFYSRAFLIESTAFFFGFCFLLTTARQIARPSHAGMWILLLSGSLCALVKITTFCAFCFPCLIYPILSYRNASPDGGKMVFYRSLKILPLAVLVPLVLGVMWTHHADSIKRASPATIELTSAGMSRWNFGSLAQRFDPSAWSDLSAKISFGLTFYPFLILVFAVLIFLKPVERKAVGLFVLSFFLPVLVFFNLHVVHDYYYYASSIFLIFAMGYMLSCLVRRGSKWGVLLWLTLAISFVAMYGSFLFRIQYGQNRVLEEVVEAVRDNTQDGDFLLIYGEEWNSRIPYYTKRKAFMNYFLKREEIEGLDAKMAALEGQEHIQLAVVNTETLPMQPYLLQELRSFGFSSQPDVIVHGYWLYRKPKLP